MNRLYRRRPGWLAATCVLTSAAGSAVFAMLALSDEPSARPLPFGALPASSAQVHPAVIEGIEQLERVRAFAQRPISAATAEQTELIRFQPPGMAEYVDPASVRLGHHAIHIQGLTAERCQAYALSKIRSAVPGEAGWHCVQRPGGTPELLYRAFPVPEDQRGFRALELREQRTLRDGSLRYRLEADEKLLAECPGRELPPGRSTLNEPGIYCVRAFEGEPFKLADLEGFYYPGESIAELRLAGGGAIYELSLHAHAHEAGGSQDE